MFCRMWIEVLYEPSFRISPLVRLLRNTYISIPRVDLASYPGPLLERIYVRLLTPVLRLTEGLGSEIAYMTSQGRKR